MFICNFSMLCVAQGEDFLPFDFSLKRNQPRSVGVRGRKTRLFAKQKCRALLVYKQSYGCFEMVLSPEAKQNIFMTALRWFVSRENH